MNEVGEGLRWRVGRANGRSLRKKASGARGLLGTAIAKVQPLYCATANRLEDYPRQFASNFDCITLNPVSGKHQVWLDFRKPLNLGPDRCSNLFYVENRDALRPYCAGTQEPDDLEGYVQFLAEQQNAIYRPGLPWTAAS